MIEKRLYGYAAIFDTPDEIIKAAEEVRNEGYKKFDVHSPYPIHGMPKAMNLPPSKLGYAALIFGLTGAITALLITFWISAVDYPLIIGGKPFFSFPAYVPVIFEVTVLSASIATVVTMLFIIFKFPNNSHPLNDTEYMKKVSSDKYGIVIQANDDIFDDSKVVRLFEKLGSKEIIPIYFDNNEINKSIQLLEPKFLLFLVLVSAVTSGLTYFTLNKLLYMPPFSWMMEQSKLNPQHTSNIFKDRFGMRTPVEGTVARGHMPFMFKDKPEEAGKYLVNPLPVSKSVLQLGQKKYDIYCSPCHGYYGEGDSRLRGQFPNPPSLHTEKLKTWSDGRFFYVITEGQNIMPSYSTQLTADERWAIVHYIRVLQRSLNARETDLQ
ncbi:quinol:electron acceptor oxidoreductase subunit ActD [Rosettibacter firmus]|uniref:quinol:electron acceptor oxidoreductase subunit ActD n=1 Tax=Rosettibacter firmus TaxID=3111522 RepID=UPI00336BCE22